MAMTTQFEAVGPAREEVDQLAGPAVIEFGTDWCGFCRAAQPLIAAAFTNYPQVRHIKVEDGKGKRLGRSYTVKLWPTLIFLKDGKEVSRLVRPDSADEIRQALAQISQAPNSMPNS